MNICDWNNEIGSSKRGQSGHGDIVIGIGLIRLIRLIGVGGDDDAADLGLGVVDIDLELRELRVVVREDAVLPRGVVLRELDRIIVVHQGHDSNHSASNILLSSNGTYTHRTCRVRRF